MYYPETEFLRQLARSWNNLDIGFIERLLAEDIVYESQWVLVPIEGKKALLSHLDLKFRSIRYFMQNEFMKISAELAVHPQIQYQPCVVLTQVVQDETRKVTVLVQVEHQKIKRIDVCFVPDPIKAQLMGEFPK